MLDFSGSLTLFVSASSSTRLQPKPAAYIPSVAKVQNPVASLNHHSFQSLELFLPSLVV